MHVAVLHATTHEHLAGFEVPPVHPYKVLIHKYLVAATADSNLANSGLMTRSAVQPGPILGRLHLGEDLAGFRLVLRQCFEQRRGWAAKQRIEQRDLATVSKDRGRQRWMTACGQRARHMPMKSPLFIQGRVAIIQLHEGLPTP